MATLENIVERQHHADVSLPASASGVPSCASRMSADNLNGVGGGGAPGGADGGESAPPDADAAGPGDADPEAEAEMNEGATSGGEVGSTMSSVGGRGAHKRRVKPPGAGAGLLDLGLDLAESSDDSDFRIEDHPDESDDCSIDSDDNDNDNRNGQSHLHFSLLHLPLLSESSMKTLDFDSASTLPNPAEVWLSLSHHPVEDCALNLVLSKLV